MLLKLNEVKLLADAIGIISELVTEVRIKLDSSGMNIVAIDPANVALVMFKIPASGFSAFEAGEETLGVNLEDLKQVLRRCSAGSVLTIEKQENLLKLSIEDRIKRTFTLSLIDIEAEEKTKPNLTFTSKVEMYSMSFVESIEDCAVVADVCELKVKDNSFVIIAKGALNSAKSEYSSDEVQMENTGENKARYSLEYLQKFIKAAKLTERVIIRFSQDYPLRLDFNTPRLELGFILAPRVETED